MQASTLQSTPAVAGLFSQPVDSQRKYRLLLPIPLTDSNDFENSAGQSIFAGALETGVSSHDGQPDSREDSRRPLWNTIQESFARCTEVTWKGQSVSEMETSSLTSRISFLGAFPNSIKSLRISASAALRAAELKQIYPLDWSGRFAIRRTDSAQQTVNDCITKIDSRS